MKNYLGKSSTHNTYKSMERGKKRHNEIISGERRSPLEISLFTRIFMWVFGVLIVAATLYFVFIF